MAIPFYDFKNLHHEKFRTNIKDKVCKIIDEGSFIEGHYNFEFEKDFAIKQGAKHCLLVANGTDALEISLLAYDIKPGDRVGIPGITFYATAEAVLNIGAIPVFIDVDSKTGLIDLASTERMIEKENLKAIIPVHIYGMPAPIKDLENICSPRNIKIIEDAAQAQGALLPTGAIGSTQNLTTFSFYPTKNLSAFGDAGAILTQDDMLAEKIKSIRNHGRGSDEILGRNSRCDHIQAAVLYSKLKEIDTFNKNRKTTAKKYFEALKDLPFQLLPDHFIETSSWHLFPVQLDSQKQRLDLAAHLKKCEIPTAPYYELSLSQMNQLKKYSGEKENAENFSGKTLCLPIHPFLSDSDVAQVTQVVRGFYA